MTATLRRMNRGLQFNNISKNSNVVFNIPLYFWGTRGIVVLIQITSTENCC